MIKFSLVCENGHAFESWFASGAAYDHQTEHSLIGCPACGSSKVTKAIMAPAIASSRGRVIEGEIVTPQSFASQSVASQGVAPQSMAPQPVEPDATVPALLDPQHREVRAMMGAIRAQIIADTVDVGKSFPEEARKMHDGESPERPIRGEASAEEVHALIEEGVKILPVPAAPEDLN